VINPISFFIYNFVSTGVHSVKGCSDLWCDCGVPKEVCVLEGIKITSLVIVCLQSDF